MFRIRTDSVYVLIVLGAAVGIGLITACGGGSSEDGPAPEAGAQILAFPEAEGFGRFAQGGRGGRVIEVTNLEDSGPGSLRQCVEVESGPRTCVFRVSGHIEVVKFGAGGGFGPSIDVLHPYLTIAGQTAPGDGISVKGLIWIQTDHVIVRHLRSRPGWKVPNNWNFGIGGSHVILDHCSATWSTDEGIFISGKKDITVQWSIVAEGIQDGSVPNERRQSKGINLGGAVENVTLHHNYMAMNMVRNPIIGVASTGSAFQIVDVVNNLVYYLNDGGGGDVHTGNGASHSNWVGNAYIQHRNAAFRGFGSLRTTGNLPYTSASGVFLKGNIDSKRHNNAEAEHLFVWQDNGPFPLVSARYPAPPLNSETDAFQAYEEVLAKAGARLPVLDSVDARVLSFARSATFRPGNVTSGTAGAIIKHETDVGGFPTYSPGAPPDDRDHDGMPDAWEELHGLDPNNPTDGPQDADSDGYSNLEEYLNQSDPLLKQ